MSEGRRHLVWRLNDRLRQSHSGGQVMITRGVQALGPEFVAAALRAVAAFDSFDAENDPHGEHDLGALTVRGERLLFKVDAYDRTLTVASPKPANPAVTIRVLTIMLVEEYCAPRQRHRYSRRRRDELGGCSWVD